MEHVKRLYLVNEGDRKYKRLQRSAVAVAKTQSAIELNDTLHNSNLDNHEKARQYIAKLHCYLKIIGPAQTPSWPNN